MLWVLETLELDPEGLVEQDPDPGGFSGAGSGSDELGYTSPTQR